MIEKLLAALSGRTTVDLQDREGVFVAPGQPPATIRTYDGAARRREARTPDRGRCLDVRG